MTVAKEIKQKIVLDGEQQYRNALKEAQRNLKTLRSELKAETAELGANATAQQKNEVRVRSLKAQIKEQQAIVKTYRDALAEVREKYKDNADMIAKWETKLNDARTSLANMENELTRVNNGLKDTKGSADMATVATKSVADAMGSIGQAGAAVSDAIEGLFGKMLDTIGEAVGEMYALIVETAGKANGWADSAEFWGTSAATIQQWEHAVKGAHDSFDALNNVMTKLTFGGKEKEVAELLGLSNNGYANQWDFGIAAMDELARLRGENIDKYYEALEKIFGAKKSVEVMDLVDDWDTIKAGLGTFDAENGGYGLSEAEIEFMSTLATKIDTVNEKWSALRDNFATKLATISADLLVNVEGGIDGINKYLNAESDEEKQAALIQIRENVEGFFRKVSDILREAIQILSDVGHDLQESEDPVTKLVGDILVKITEALQWCIDHQNEVIAAFKAIFAVALMGHLAAAGAKLASVLTQIEAIKAFRGMSTAAGAASAAGTAAGASWGAAFGMAVKSAIPWLAGLLGIGLVVMDSLNNHGDDSFATDEEGNVIVQQDENGEYYLTDHDTGQRVYGNEGWEIGGTTTAADVKAAEEHFKTQKELQAAQLAAFGVYEENGQLYEPTTNNKGWTTYRKADRVIATPEEWAMLQRWFDLDKSGDRGGEMDDITDRLSDSVYDAFMKMYNDWYMTKEWNESADLPESWYINADKWNEGNGITSGDLQGFRGLPAQMKEAVRSGLRNMRVDLDGYAVGRMIAPYVSEEIAKEIP